MYMGQGAARISECSGQMWLLRLYMGHVEEKDDMSHVRACLRKPHIGLGRALARLTGAEPVHLNPGNGILCHRKSHRMFSERISASYRILQESQL